MTEEKSALTVPEIVAMDKRRRRLKERAAAMSKRHKGLEEEIISAMKKLGTRVLQHEGWTVTYTAAEVLVYDPALVDALTPSQQVLACDKMLNINTLPPDVRKAVMAALGVKNRKALRPVLNVDRLSQAVQAGKIPASLVAKFTSLKTNAAYITPGGGPVQPR